MLINDLVSMFFTGCKAVTYQKTMHPGMLWGCGVIWYTRNCPFKGYTSYIPLVGLRAYGLWILSRCIFQSNFDNYFVKYKLSACFLYINFC